MTGPAWERVELNHLVQDDHRVTAGYLTVRSHSPERRGHLVRAVKRAKPAEVLPRRAPGAISGWISAAYESGAPAVWGITCLRVLSSWRSRRFSVPRSCRPCMPGLR